MQNNIPKPAKKIISTILALAFWLGLWLFFCKRVGVELLIPSPAAVLKKLFEFLGQREFYATVLNSFSGITKGYIFGVLAGVLLGVLISFSDIMRAVFKPFLTAVKTTPVVSFIILALIWIDREKVPVFITFLMVMPIITAGILNGLRSADKELLEMARAYKFTFRQRLKYIYLPSAVPSFSNGCETAIGLGWKAGIAAEVICMSQDTLGKALKNSQVYLETTELFAWTAVVIIISLILEKLLVALFELIFKGLIKKGGYFIEHTNK